jgi:glutamine synthetase
MSADHAGFRENSTFAFVVQRAHEQEVDAIELWAVDPEGRIQVVDVPMEALEEILEAGFLLSSDSFATSSDSSGLILRPDPHTFHVLASQQGAASRATVARLLCDLQQPDGTPSPLCARSRLKEVLARTSHGPKLYVGATIEHRWLETPTSPVPLGDPRLMRDLARATVTHLERLGIPWRSHYPGRATTRVTDLARWSFEFEWVDPLMLADSLVTHRRIVREVALEAGRGATFMPHPWASSSRTALELFISCMDAGVPLFGDPLSGDGLSLIGKRVSLALESALPETALLTRPNVNSYTGPDLPQVGAIAAGRSEAGPCIALSGIDASANPYLVLSAVVGFTHAAVSSPHKVEARASSFPETLVEAIRRGLESPSMRTMLGGEMLDALAALGRSDASHWREQVTPWEVTRYL